MITLIKAGSFNLQGNKVGPTLQFDVYRKGGMLVVEFLNNAVLPIKVKRDIGGANMLYVRNHPLFKSAVGDDEVLNIWFFFGLTASDVDISLTVGDLNSPRLSALVQMHTYGYISFAPDSQTSYSYEEMSAWCSANGVVIPVGFTSALSQFAGNAGYECLHNGDRYLISFPNGFKFPIFRHEFGIRVVDSDICFASAIRCICVRVRYIDRDMVVFRLAIVAGENGDHIMCRDNIKYSRETIEYCGRVVKSSIITKQMLMSGG